MAPGVIQFHILHGVFVLHSPAMCSSQWARTLPQKNSQEQNFKNTIPCLRGHSTCPSNAGFGCLSRYSKPKPASGFLCSHIDFHLFERIWLFLTEPLLALPLHIHTCLHIATTKSYLLPKFTTCICSQIFSPLTPCFH